MSRSGIWSHHGSIAICFEGMLELSRKARDYARDAEDEVNGAHIWDFEQQIKGFIRFHSEENEKLCLTTGNNSLSETKIEKEGND